jgi:lysylphosphatidylglycerol synthetase-like protein (DUF2156 family)
MFNGPEFLRVLTPVGLSDPVCDARHYATMAQAFLEQHPEAMWVQVRRVEQWAHARGAAGLSRQASVISLDACSVCSRSTANPVWAQCCVSPLMSTTLPAVCCPQTSHEFAGVLAGLGFTCNSMGGETRMDLATFEITGECV